MLKYLQYVVYIPVALKGVQVAKSTVDSLKFLRKCYRFVRKGFKRKKKEPDSTDNSNNNKWTLIEVNS